MKEAKSESSPRAAPCSGECWLALGPDEGNRNHAPRVRESREQGALLVENTFLRRGSLGGSIEVGACSIPSRTFSPHLHMFASDVPRGSLSLAHTSLDQTYTHITHHTPQHSGGTCHLAQSSRSGKTKGRRDRAGRQRTSGDLSLTLTGGGGGARARLGNMLMISSLLTVQPHSNHRRSILGASPGLSLDAAGLPPRRVWRDKPPLNELLVLLGQQRLQLRERVE